MNGPHFHACSVSGCGRKIPDHFLMCKKHWYLCPADLREEVWEAWHRYQAKELPLSDLREVQKRATEAVEQACGKNATRQSAESDQAEQKGGAA